MPNPFAERIRRLITLHDILALDCLGARRGVTSDRIRSEVECARKAVYGYVRELRELGAPVDYNMEQHVWLYREPWNLPWQPVEVFQDGSGVRLALAYLLDPLLKQQFQDRLMVHPQLLPERSQTIPRLTGRIESHVLGRIAVALRQHRRIEFHYRKPGKHPAEKRLLEPHEVFEWDGMLYLQGRAVDRPGSPWRRFALSRMKKMTICEETFRPPSSRSTPTCLGAFIVQPFEAVMSADADHAVYVMERKWHPKQTTTPQADGSVEFKILFGDVNEAARWLLGHGPGFTPVAPPAFVDAWRDMVRKLASALP